VLIERLGGIVEKHDAHAHDSAKDLAANPHGNKQDDIARGTAALRLHHRRDFLADDNNNDDFEHVLSVAAVARGMKSSLGPIKYARNKNANSVAGGRRSRIIKTLCSPRKLFLEDMPCNSSDLRFRPSAV